MTETLYIGDRSYSSWSLRGWLVFARFDLPVAVRWIDFTAAEVRNQVKALAPSRTVPTLQLGDGTVIWDSLAIAEELSSRYPEAGLWPSDPAARATARSLAAEMHSGFGALREVCPMNLRVAYAGFDAPSDVLADVARLEELWAYARASYGAGGPWLCGAYSAADAFFAPVAARIATYGLQVGPDARAYVAAHLADPAFRQWRAMGFASGEELPWYAMSHARRAWPGPVARAAVAVESGTPENTACPYSGKPVTHLMEMEGRIFGFCNAFCRDKTVADPEAWPKFMALVSS